MTAEKISYLKSKLEKAENAAAFAVNPRMAAYPKAEATQIRHLLEKAGVTP